MNEAPIGATPRRQDPAPARRERRAAVPPLLDAARFEHALRRGGTGRDGGEDTERSDAIAVLPSMPAAPPLVPVGSDGGDGDNGARGAAGDSPRGSRGGDDDAAPQDRTAQPAPIAPDAPDAPAPPRPDVVSPRDPAGAVQPPSSTLQALAQAGTAPRSSEQWRFEIDPQPLQQGLTLQAERLPPVHGIAGGTGAPAWSLQLHLPVALASGASAAGRERLEQRLRRGGIALRDVELHARYPQQREENDDDA